MFFLSILPPCPHSRDVVKSIKVMFRILDVLNVKYSGKLFTAKVAFFNTITKRLNNVVIKHKFQAELNIGKIIFHL